MPQHGATFSLFLFIYFAFFGSGIHFLNECLFDTAKNSHRTFITGTANTFNTVGKTI